LPQTICLARTSWELANQYARDPEAFPDPLFLDTLGISPAEGDTARSLARDGESSAKADPVVSVVIAAISGYLYEHLIGLSVPTRFPELRLPASPSALLLDVGCNWGRWTIAAARKKYKVVGIDPSLGAVLAAKRLSMHLGVDNHYVCGDARYLPFAAAQFDNVFFSYSVLQHFSKADVQVAFDEAAQVLKTDGRILVQLAPCVRGAQPVPPVAPWLPRARGIRRPVLDHRRDETRPRPALPCARSLRALLLRPGARAFRPRLRSSRWAPDDPPFGSATKHQSLPSAAEADSGQPLRVGGQVD
jgi:SAM-dependent methyltransferase